MQQEQTQLEHKANTSQLEIQMYRFPTPELLNESPIPDDNDDGAHGHRRIESKYIANILGKNRGPKVEITDSAQQQQNTIVQTDADDEKEQLVEADKNGQKDLKGYIESNKKQISVIKVENFEDDTQKNQFHPNAEANDRSFEVLLSGHGSIKHRIQAMGQLKANLGLLDIESDNGRVLIHAFAVQILHIDYIHNEHQVRNQAIDYIADVFIACLDALSRNKIPELVQDTLPEILDNLFKILDDAESKDMHDEIQQVIIQIIKAIDAKRSKSAIINVCELLVEKANIATVALVCCRLFCVIVVFTRCGLKRQLLVFLPQSKFSKGLYFGIDRIKSVNGFLLI